MAVVIRNGRPYLYVKPFAHLKKVGLSLPLSGTEAQMRSEALVLESILLKACRDMDFYRLDDTAREVCTRVFQALDLEIPSDLGGIIPVAEPERALTLWRGCELFLKYPEVRPESRQYKYQLCLAHLVEYFGKEFPIKNLWVPEIRAYQSARLEEGASPSTINWEKGTLSKMFQVLVEMRLTEVNPVHLVKNLSQKSEERQAYLS